MYVSYAIYNIIYVSILKIYEYIGILFMTETVSKS